MWVDLADVQQLQDAALAGALSLLSRDPHAATDLANEVALQFLIDREHGRPVNNDLGYVWRAGRNAAAAYGRRQTKLTALSTPCVSPTPQGLLKDRAAVVPGSDPHVAALVAVDVLHGLAVQGKMERDEATYLLQRHVMGDSIEVIAAEAGRSSAEVLAVLSTAELKVFFAMGATEAQAEAGVLCRLHDVGQADAAKMLKVTHHALRKRLSDLGFRVKRWRSRHGV
jgi:DNA-directed RNA polymerase specialized sigma24 family protein